MRGLLKFRVLFLIVMLFISANSFAQVKALVMENTKTGEQKQFKTGRNFEFKLQNHQLFSEGDLHSVSDSSIVIDTETIYISDIAAVRKRSGTHTFFKIIGVPVMIAGFGLIYLGGSNLIAALKEPDRNTNEEVKEEIKGSALTTAGGIAMVGFGFIPFSVDNKEYAIGGEWKLKVINL